MANTTAPPSVDVLFSASALGKANQELLDFRLDGQAVALFVGSILQRPKIIDEGMTIVLYTGDDYHKLSERPQELPVFNMNYLWRDVAYPTDPDTLGGILFAVFVADDWNDGATHASLYESALWYKKALDKQEHLSLKIAGVCLAGTIPAIGAGMMGPAGLAAGAVLSGGGYAAYRSWQRQRPVEQTSLTAALGLVDDEKRVRLPMRAIRKSDVQQSALLAADANHGVA